MTKPIPPDIQAYLQHHLGEIGKLFRSSKITLIARAVEGGNATGDLVLTSDDPGKVIETLRTHMIAAARRFADEGARSGTPGAEFPHQPDHHWVPPSPRERT